MEPINLSILLRKSSYLDFISVAQKPTMKFGMVVAIAISFLTPIFFRLQIKDRIYIHL
jgi:hypothetical protein